MNDHLRLALNPRHPSRLDERLRAQLVPTPVTPFPIAPASAITTGPHLLATQADGTPISVNADEAAMHTLITGRTGGGKTMFLLNYLSTLLTSVRLWLLDLKDDTRFLAAHHPGMLIIDGHTPFAPLKVPSYLTRAEHANLFITTFAGALYGAENTKQVLTEALQHAYTVHPTPSLVDLKDTLAGLSRKDDTYARRDAIRGTKQRLERFAEQYPGIAASRNGIGVDTLCRYSLYFGTPLLTELEEFLFSFLVHHLYRNNRARQQRTLSHLIVMDEGHASWGAERSTQRIGGQPLLATLQPMTREFGIGFTITTNSFLTTDPVLKSNTYLHACTRLAHAEDVNAVARTYGLTPEQATYLHQLPPGEVVIHRANWPHPILGRYHHLALNKAVTPAAWHAATQRTLRLLPPALPASIRSTPSPPHAVIASTAAPLIALNTTEAALLAYLCKHPLTPATTAYNAVRLHPQAGTTARDKLQTLGLLTVE